MGDELETILELKPEDIVASSHSEEKLLGLIKQLAKRLMQAEAAIVTCQESLS